MMLVLIKHAILASYAQLCSGFSPSDAHLPALHLFLPRIVCIIVLACTKNWPRNASKKSPYQAANWEIASGTRIYDCCILSQYIDCLYFLPIHLMSAPSYFKNGLSLFEVERSTIRVRIKTSFLHNAMYWLTFWSRLAASSISPSLQNENRR